MNQEGREQTHWAVIALVCDFRQKLTGEHEVGEGAAKRCSEGSGAKCAACPGA